MSTLCRVVTASTGFYPSGAKELLETVADCRLAIKARSHCRRPTWGNSGLQ